MIFSNEDRYFTEHYLGTVFKEWNEFDLKRVRHFLFEFVVSLRMLSG